jgi:hypothetical protein
MGTVKGGRLYPLLTRFEAAGLVEIDWRPGAGVGTPRARCSSGSPFTRTTKALRQSSEISERTRA